MSGHFSISYTPPSPAKVLYLVALGGNVSGVNSAIGLSGVLGLSDAAPSSVTINELTTVAAEWALAQFTDSTGTQIGAPSTDAIGLTNAANQAQANLADVTTGGLPTFLSALTCPPASGPTPPNCDGQERMNTFANILWSCVQSSSSASANCTGLLGYTAGSTTLSAAHFMAANPVSSTATTADLYALQTFSSPFTPKLNATPDGTEIALNFAPGGLTSQALAIDSHGGVWVNNSSASPSVLELSSSGATLGNFTADSNFVTPSGIAIDDSGNVWVADQSGAVIELASNGAYSNSFGASTNATGIAADGAGDIWVTSPGADGLTELSPSGNTYSSSGIDPNGPSFDDPIGIAIDKSSNVWIANHGASDLIEVQGGNTSEAFGASSALSQPYAIAIDAIGNIWVADQDYAGIIEVTTIDTVNTYQPEGGDFGAPAGIALDTAGNVWLTNHSTNCVTQWNTNSSTAGFFAPAGDPFVNPAGIAIDASGDVWVVNSNVDDSSVTEIIGAAGPVLTPIAACLDQASPGNLCLP